MGNPNFSTEHRKGQHLTEEERRDIEVHLKDGWSKYKIARHLNRPYNTIKNEIRRGTVAMYHGKVFRYSPDDILHLADLMNALPRKILGYHTPEELFEKEPDRSYAA